MSEKFGKATHWPSMRETRTPPIGPENGRPEICVDGARRVDREHVVLVVGVQREARVMTTWTSLRRPFVKVGRSGRSMSRQVRIASVEGRPSRRKNEPGILPIGVHALFDVHGQGEEVELVLGLLARRRWCDRSIVSSSR